MAAQRGKDLLIKLDMGSGGFETIAGLRATRITFTLPGEPDDPA